jgi:hypothetical protein
MVMNREAIEAEFEVCKPKTQYGVPATLETFQLHRHELCQGTNNGEIEKMAKELEIDKQLGLKNQCEITAEAALQRDIDDLTSSKDYVQVSKKLLEKLFSIGGLKRICTLHTIISFLHGMVTGARVPLIIIASVLALLYPMCFWSGIVASHQTNPGTVCLGILLVAGWIAMLMGTIFGIYFWCEDVQINYDHLEVKLDMEPLSSVDTKIPYGAKLKVLEAQKTGIFKDFVYASPKFTVDTRTWQNTLHINIDPAILGVTKDSRMFMVVYWDVIKDKERVIKEINQFKKFKLA